jgi:hypothetical protein
MSFLFCAYLLARGHDAHRLNGSHIVRQLQSFSVILYRKFWRGVAEIRVRLRLKWEYTATHLCAQ